MVPGAFVGQGIHLAKTKDRWFKQISFPHATEKAPSSLKNIASCQSELVSSQRPAFLSVQFPEAMFSLSENQAVNLPQGKNNLTLFLLALFNTHAHTPFAFRSFKKSIQYFHLGWEESRQNILDQMACWGKGQGHNATWGSFLLHFPSSAYFWN